MSAPSDFGADDPYGFKALIRRSKANNRRGTRQSSRPVSVPSAKKRFKPGFRYRRSMNAYEKPASKEREKRDRSLS
jgi:hypothetical protein